jgi:hypothetical protein
MGVLPIILTILRVAYFLFTEGPEIWAMIKEIIDMIRGLRDGGEQVALAAELSRVVDETVDDWRRGDRSGRRLREFHARVRGGKSEPAPRRRRKGGANA